MHTSHCTDTHCTEVNKSLYKSVAVTVPKCTSRRRNVTDTAQKCTTHCTEVYHSLYRSALLCSVIVHKHALYRSAPVMVPVTTHRIKTRWTSLQRRSITCNTASSREADNTPSMTVYKTALYGKKTRTWPYSLSDSSTKVSNRLSSWGDPVWHTPCIVFSPPSSKLYQNWLRHWRGTLYLCTAVHRRCQRLQKGLGSSKTVEAA